MHIDHSAERAEGIVLGIVVFAGVLAGAIPALRACWNSLADGTIVRT